MPGATSMSIHNELVRSSLTFMAGSNAAQNQRGGSGFRSAPGRYARSRAQHTAQEHRRGAYVDPAPASRCIRPLTVRKEPAMGLFSKDIKTMDDLFLHVVQDIYYAENQIVKSLPDMIEKATNRELSSALKSHLGETEKQVKRLEQVFELLGKSPQGASCPAIDGIIDEANELAGEIEDKKVLDAALLAAAQAVEHYEITRYGTLIAWADELGRNDIGKLLATTLKEEKAADKKLSGIAEKKVNLKAAS
jgi:ferritin-like metal-binding protein YciE